MYIKLKSYNYCLKRIFWWFEILSLFCCSSFWTLLVDGIELGLEWMYYACGIAGYSHVSSSTVGWWTAGRRSRDEKERKLVFFQSSCSLKNHLVVWMDAVDGHRRRSKYYERAKHHHHSHSALIVVIILFSVFADCIVTLRDCNVSNKVTK